MDDTNRRTAGVLNRPRGISDHFAATERTAAAVQALFTELGIERANVAACVMSDLHALACIPARVAGLTVLSPQGPDPRLLRPPERLTVVSGEGAEGNGAGANPDVGPDVDADVDPAGAPARRVVLSGYDWLIWSDVVADHGDRVATALLEGAANGDASILTPVGEPQGVVDGVHYRMRGAGPVLVLMPLALAPSQWSPIIDRLAEQCCVVIVGGRRLGFTAVLEDRGASPTYRSMLAHFIDTFAVGERDAVLEVGCGTGVCTRLVAERTNARRIVGVDINDFLREEAARFAEARGVADRIELVAGDAESLPFADASFDVAYSVTVFEECDAERAIAELQRVTRPGGTVGVIVRATDWPVLVNVDGSAELRAALAGNDPLVGPDGCADASLYRRMLHAGLIEPSCFPSYATFDTRLPERLHLLLVGVEARMPDALLPEFRRAVDQAWEAQTLFLSQPFHCCVARKPA